MYDRETVELALFALEDGMTKMEAAGLSTRSSPAEPAAAPRRHARLLRGGPRPLPGGRHHRVPASVGGEGRLSPVVDRFDGRPVAWSVGPRLTARLANSSLEAACATLAPGEAPAVHSDRGGYRRWPGRLHGRARRVDALVPQRPHIGEVGLARPGRAPRGVGLPGAVGCARKRPQFPPMAKASPLLSARATSG